MPNGGGNDRLDRIEALLRHTESMLGQIDLRQVDQQLPRFELRMIEFDDKMTRMQDRLNRLIEVVEADHRDFKERMKRRKPGETSF